MSISRYTIHAKDIAIIEGLQQRSAENKFTTYRNLHKKKPHQPLTIKEYCEYMGFEYDHFLKQYKNLFSIEIRKIQLP